MVTTPVQERSRATHRRLLNAAADLVEERGYAGTSVQAICERAGCTTGAFYARFGSKDALGTAFVDVLLEAADSVMERFETSTEPPTKAIGNLFNDAAAVYAKRAGLLRATLELAGQNHEVALGLRLLNDRSLRRIVRTVERRLEAAESRPSREAILIGFLSALTLLRESVLGARLFEEAAVLSRDRLVDELTVMVMRYLEIPDG